MTRPALVGLLSALTCCWVGTSARASAGAFSREGARLMGTHFQIVAFVESPEQQFAIGDALNDIAALESLWSPWVAGSDVQRINDAAGRRMVAIAPETAALLRRSFRQCQDTQGAFDPTFYALSPLYRLSDPGFEPPAEEDLRAALTNVGCDGVLLDPSADRAGLARVGMRLHLGGNAKGTALDVAARRLVAAGISRFVVDGGGDIVVRGTGPKGPWRVGIQDPRGSRGATVGVVTADGGAVATSGDYERFAIRDGRRFHHIIDPRNGQPARDCRSVTVTVPPGDHAGELADSLATALCVLGPRDGLRVLASVQGASAVMIDGRGAVHRSPGFSGWMSPSGSRQADARQATR